MNESTDGIKTRSEISDEEVQVHLDANLAKAEGKLHTGVDKQLDNKLSPDLSTAFARSDSQLSNRQQRYPGTSVPLRNLKGNTALQQCVEEELDKYFAMLEGHPPSDLYKLVIAQVETALFSYVLDMCGNNQSRAAEYLGVSRGTLRNRIVDLSLD